MGYFVYILISRSHSRYYIGQTNDFKSRLLRHNAGYEMSTAPYRPWLIALVIDKATRSEAVILERKLKNLNTADLEKFILKYGGTTKGGEVNSP